MAFMPVPDEYTGNVYREMHNRAYECVLPRSSFRQKAAGVVPTNAARVEPHQACPYQLDDNDASRMDTYQREILHHGDGAEAHINRL
jgi:hypothetical protein